MELLFHSDDYGISENASKVIISCIDKGIIRSISVIPNMSYFDESMQLLNAERQNHSVKINVHLNIMEGYCVAKKEKLKLLVDEKGLFKLSWGKLLLLSIFKSKQLSKELNIEFRAQIEKVLNRLPQSYRLRMDSHQHTHMIPGVFKTLVECVEKEDYDVEYIRVAAEKVWPFLRAYSLWKTYKPINVIKNVLLNLFGFYDTYLLNKCVGIKASCFMGVIFSGHMDIKRVEKILANMQKEADGSLEVLFHPGSVLKHELGTEFNKETFNNFHLSTDRKVEERAVKSDVLKSKMRDNQSVYSL